MSLSNYAEDAILNHLSGLTPLPAPSDLYLALFTTAPTESSPGVEFTGGSYTRQAVTFTPSDSGMIVSSADVVFSGLAAGTLRGTALLDSLTGGNIIVFSALPAPRGVSDGETLTVSAGTITVSLD